MMLVLEPEEVCERRKMTLNDHHKILSLLTSVSYLFSSTLSSSRSPSAFYPSIPSSSAPPCYHKRPESQESGLEQAASSPSCPTPIPTRFTLSGAARLCLSSRLAPS